MKQWPEFSEFYTEMKSERLERIYEGLEHPVLTEIMNQIGNGNSTTPELLKELAAKLPSVILDIAGVATTHFLHEYHHWLKAYLTENGL